MRVDSMQLACTQEAVQARGPFATCLTAAEGPVAAPDGYGPNLSFHAVVVNGDGAVIGVPAKPRPLIPRIVDRSTHWTLRQDVRRRGIERAFDLIKDLQALLLSCREHDSMSICSMRRDILRQLGSSAARLSTL